MLEYVLRAVAVPGFNAQQQIEVNLCCILFLQSVCTDNTICIEATINGATCILCNYIETHNALYVGNSGRWSALSSHGSVAQICSFSVHRRPAERGQRKLRRRPRTSKLLLFLTFFCLCIRVCVWVLKWIVAWNTCWKSSHLLQIIKCPLFPLIFTIRFYIIDSLCVQ